MSPQSPQVVVGLFPRGPLVLVYVGAVYAAGKFFGHLVAWLADRLGIARWLGFSLSQQELRDELESRFGLFAGSFYLLVWLFTLLEIGHLI